MKDKIFGVLQRVGRSFMLPIAMLPIAGLLLGIGSSFTNPTTLEAYHLTRMIRQGGILYSILTIMKATGSVVFDNLALLFAELAAKGTEHFSVSATRDMTGKFPVMIICNTDDYSSVRSVGSGKISAGEPILRIQCKQENL